MGQPAVEYALAKLHFTVYVVTAQSTVREMVTPAEGRSVAIPLLLRCFEIKNLAALRWNGRLPPKRAAQRRGARVLSARHCWFGSPAAKENQMEPMTIAIDLAKRVFQTHYVEPDTGTIESKVLRRAQIVPFFANRPASRVVMEPCGSAHLGSCATTCGSSQPSSCRRS
jgi:hypothetical protein